MITIAIMLNQSFAEWNSVRLIFSRRAHGRLRGSARGCYGSGTASFPPKTCPHSSIPMRAHGAFSCVRAHALRAPCLSLWQSPPSSLPDGTATNSPPAPLPRPRHQYNTLDVRFLGYLIFLKNAAKMLRFSRFKVHPVFPTHHFLIRLFPGYRQFISRK